MSVFYNEREDFSEEFDKYFKEYPINIYKAEEHMKRWDSENPDVHPFACKAELYRTALKYCNVKIFCHSPFYSEIAGGRERNSWGFGGIGGYVQSKNRWMNDEYLRRKVRMFDEGLWGGSYRFVDIDHQVIGGDNLLRCGLDGIYKKAEKKLSEDGLDIEQIEFLKAVMTAMECLSGFGKKFAECAKAKLADERNPTVIKRLERIADTAGRIPKAPPETFYEAVNTLWWIREASGSLEGIGVSTLGQVDRMLWPYLEKDLRLKRITEDEAMDLVRWLLSLTDARWDLQSGQETSTTIMLGGCDTKGNVIYNDLTKMFMHAAIELNLLNPKINVRVSKKHPREFVELSAELSLKASNNIAFLNDDVLIPAGVRMGKEIQDVRNHSL